MAFISYEFLGFLAVVLAAYYLMPLGWRRLWLVAASLVFCAWSSPASLVQAIVATAWAYWIALRIEQGEDKPKKQRALAWGIGLLALNLLVFKYAGFFNETVRAWVSALGLTYPAPPIDLPLPLGVSFYSFLLIGYLIDVFRGAKAERDPGVFALFSLFLPKFVAGPIERSRNFLPQAHAEHRFDAMQVAFGLQLILWGAFKKLVVADRLSPLVAKVYDDPYAADGVMTTLATTLYALVIYADFSGYTDMALGVAALFGFTLINNFRQPYLATSIQDFWKRWHISLTFWLTDYVFTPLSRQRSVKVKFFTMILIATFLTFVLSGLWHGAEWTFVAWGALHGALIVLFMWTQKPWAAFARRIGLIDRPNLYRVLKIVSTFALVWFAYVLFRAQSFADAWHIYTHLGTGWDHAWQSVKDYAGASFAELAVGVSGFAAIFIADVLRERGFDAKKIADLRPAPMRWALYYVSALSVILLGAYFGGGQDFIYFRF